MGANRSISASTASSATNSDEPLITAVEAAPASEQDGPQAKALVDAQPEERRPERLLGDTAYGSGPVRAELADRDVEVLALGPQAPRREGPIDRHDFAIGLQAGTVGARPARWPGSTPSRPASAGRSSARAPAVVAR